MSKQIMVKSIKDNGMTKKLFEEAHTYLDSIGFIKTPLVSITDVDLTFRSFLYSQGNEKVLVEYNNKGNEEVLKLVFNPLKVQFVYDIILMRFNQLGRDQEGSIAIMSE